ncbi:MAG: S41 family peptidase, partial [Pseudobdellovibrionaceae bacterium]
LVLDLRHNTGGLVNEGKCIAQLFAGDKPIVERQPLQLEFPQVLQIEKGEVLEGDESYEWRRTFDDLPLVVMINERSASASELVAGALQDFNRAWIVGERSYGKGTTQLIHHLQNFPELRVFKTVSRYLRPNKTSPQDAGVIPNFEVPFRAGASAKERRFVREENLLRGMRLEQQAPWKETRMNQVAAIQKCLSKQKPEASADHQLEIALQIFACSP